MEETECSETSKHKIHTPGNHPTERIQHSEHTAILKSRSKILCTASLINWQKKRVKIF